MPLSIGSHALRDIYPPSLRRLERFNLSYARHLACTLWPFRAFSSFFFFPFYPQKP